jgi:hypothetical protein
LKLAIEFLDKIWTVREQSYWGCAALVRAPRPCVGQLCGVLYVQPFIFSILYAAKEFALGALLLDEKYNLPVGEE